MRWLRKRGTIDAWDIGSSLRSWLAFADFGNTAGIRRELWRRLRF